MKSKTPRALSRTDLKKLSHESSVGRPNDLPVPSHGDSLRDELGDVLGMLDSIEEHFATLGARTLPPEGYGRKTLTEARALLRSILGTK